MSQIGATFSFISNIISGGVLGFPFCYSRCGLVLGTVLLVCTALSQTFTLKQLVYASTVTRSRSFEEVRTAKRFAHAFSPPQLAFHPAPASMRWPTLSPLSPKFPWLAQLVSLTTGRAGGVLCMFCVMALQVGYLVAYLAVLADIASSTASARARTHASQPRARFAA